MSSRRDPFALALGDLRHRLRSGALVQGEQLMIAAFAHDLGLSATPVREALSRLAGEGLIEDRRGAGYFAPRLDAVDLGDLYGLSWTYLAAALAAASELESPPGGGQASAWASETGEHDPVLRVEILFDTVARRSRSATLLRAQRLLSDRLAAIRRVEPAVLVGVDEELSTLEALCAGASPHLRDHLLTYHERRRRAAADLISALRSRAATT